MQNYSTPSSDSETKSWTGPITTTGEPLSFSELVSDREVLGGDPRIKEHTVTSATTETIAQIENIHAKAQSLRNLVNTLPASHFSAIRKEAICNIITSLEDDMDHAAANLAQQMARAIYAQRAVHKDAQPTKESVMVDNAFRVMVGVLGESLSVIPMSQASLRARIDTVLWIVNGVSDGR